MTSPRQDALTASGAADRAFFGLEGTGDGRAALTLTPHLARHDGRLYGGTALGVALALAEQATTRPALWGSVQFVAGAGVGDRIDCEVEVLAHGRRASQVRVVGRLGDDVLFGAQVATATPKEAAITGTFHEPPAVRRPEECEPFSFPAIEPSRAAAPSSIEQRMELRWAVPADGRAAVRDPMLLWARCRDHPVATPAVLGYIADMVPLAVVHAAGRVGGGTSLDNTIRIGHRVDTDWVLLAQDPHAAAAGYGYGTLHLWSRDGALLATASQTFAVVAVD